MPSMFYNLIPTHCASLPRQVVLLATLSRAHMTSSMFYNLIPTHCASLPRQVVLLAMPLADRRNFLLAASELGMTSGEYIFITFDLLLDADVNEPTALWQKFDGRDAAAKAAFQALFIVSFQAGALYREFQALFIVSFQALFNVSFQALFIVSFQALFIVSFQALFIVSFQAYRKFLSRGAQVLYSNAHVSYCKQSNFGPLIKLTRMYARTLAHNYYTCFSGQWT